MNGITDIEYRITEVEVSAFALSDRAYKLLLAVIFLI